MRRTEKYGTPAAQLRALTLQEKASLLSGRGFWRTKAIPEKGRKKPVHGGRAARRAQRGQAARAPQRRRQRARHLLSPVRVRWRVRSTYTLCAAWGRPWGKKLRPRAWAFFWGRG